MFVDGHFYRPQTKFAKVMFSQVCLSGGGGVSSPLHAGIHAPDRHPLCSACWDTVNKWAVCTPLECILVSQASVILRGGGCLTDTPAHLTRQTATAADGTHSTGMYSYILIIIPSKAATLDVLIMHPF